MTQLRIGISLARLDEWFVGDLAGIAEVARLADAAGIDQLSIADHVLMTQAGAAGYPGDASYSPVALAWPEPMVMLAAIAAVTTRIELATGILIAPLRPAVLLAKQLATLDRLSHGRLIAGLGAGWQEAEYRASAMPWENRFGLLAEQVEALRALWGTQPARFQGRHISFDESYALPRPHEDRSIPIWLGLGLGPRNLDRIVRLADGWLPIRTDIDGILEEVATVREACRVARREPETLRVRASPASGLPGAGGDFAALRSEIARLAGGGVDVVQVYPFGLTDGLSGCEVLFSRLVDLRDSLNQSH